MREGEIEKEGQKSVGAVKRGLSEMEEGDGRCEMKEREGESEIE